MDSIEIINIIITQLDQLSVQGARNMSIVLGCLQQLGKLKQQLEEKKDVQNTAG
jgi:hypothetical protein